MNKLFGSNRNKKGQMAIVGVISGVIAVGIILYFGLLINQKVKSNINRSGFTTAENTTFDNTATNVNTGFELSSLVPMILVAVAIIGLFIGGALGRF